MIPQNKGHQLNGLDKYFQVLPLVENFLNETDPQLKKDSGIFFTPYSVVSFIVRSIHEILKEKLRKPMGLADETVKILDPATGTGVFLIAAARLAIELYFCHTFAWYEKGVTLSLLGRNDEALEAFNKATDIKPGHDDAWNNKRVKKERRAGIVTCLISIQQEVQMFDLQRNTGSYHALQHFSMYWVESHQLTFRECYAKFSHMAIQPRNEYDKAFYHVLAHGHRGEQISHAAISQGVHSSIGEFEEDKRFNSMVERLKCCLRCF